MNLKDARLTRVQTARGWQFIAKPHPDGTAWLLNAGVPVRAEVTTDATVYELRRGDKLHDYFDGRVMLEFKGGDTITFHVDGTALYRRVDGTLRSELLPDGNDVEYWLDGAHAAHPRWATVHLYG